MANGRGWPGPARDWFTPAAAAWEEPGDRAWAEECQLQAATLCLPVPEVAVIVVCYWLRPSPSAGRPSLMVW